MREEDNVEREMMISNCEIVKRDILVNGVVLIYVWLSTVLRLKFVLRELKYKSGRKDGIDLSRMEMCN